MSVTSPAHAATPPEAPHPLASVLPARIRETAQGVEGVEDVSIRALIDEYGSPLWVISRNQLIDNFRTLGAAAHELAPFEIAYSIKANNNLAVLEALTSAGALVDCSSEWELQIALAHGVPADRVILNGNGKSQSYLRSAVEAGVRQINVDSLAEAERLEALALQLGANVDCVVRVKLGYHALLDADPSYERTLRVAEAKFGSSILNGEADALIAFIRASAVLTFRGLSHHAGFAGYRANYTPANQLHHVRECAREMAAYASTLHSAGIPVERLDVGGGLRSGSHVLLSTPGAGKDVALHALPTPDEYAAAIADGVNTGWNAPGRPVIQFETGGFQVANAVVLLTTIQDVKVSAFPEKKRFVTVDTAMTMFTSRGSSRVGFPVVVAGRSGDAPAGDLPVEVVGPTCAYDSIAEDIALPDVREGEVLVLLNQGAYAEVTSTQFNAFPRPAVVMVDGETARLVRRRETLDDVLSREVARR